MAKQLTVACFLLREDGEAVPWEQLRPEEIRRFRERAARRLSEAMSEYYMQHPDARAVKG